MNLNDTNSRRLVVGETVNPETDYVFSEELDSWFPSRYDGPVCEASSEYRRPHAVDQTPPACPTCETSSNMVLRGNEWICHGTHRRDEPRAQSSGPRSDAAWSKFNLRGDGDPAQEMRDMETELTEERETSNRYRKHVIGHCQANVKLRKELTAANAEVARLREVFPKILKALGNGADCSAEASLQFLEQIPQEVALVVQRLKNETP